MGESIDLTQGIGEVEAMVRQSEDEGFLRLTPPGSAELARMMTYERRSQGMFIEAVYWKVNTAALQGVVEDVRTTLAELVAELRASLEDEDGTPSAQLANQAVQVAVHGSKSRVVVTNAQASDGSSAVAAPPEPEPEQSGLWTTWRRIGAAAVGLATIAGAVAAFLALHH
jgi:hypothetical protein